METTRATVIYDADCGFCKWSLALLLSVDGLGRKRSEHGRPCPPHMQARSARSAASGVFRPLPLGTAEADRLLADLTVAERNASWHLVVDSAESSTPLATAPTAPLRFSAGAAFAPALSLLPRGRIPATAVARIPRATERGYRWVVKHRGALGRFVPERARRWADRVIAAHVGPGPQ